MSTIAAIVEDFFEDVEYTEPVEAYQGAGHRVVNVGLQQGKTVRGKKNGTAVTIDVAVDNVSPADFDALLIPGGYSPDRLRAHENAVAFVREFVRSGKPVFSICHGPQILINADVVRGKKITGYTSIIPDLRNAGADFVDDEVVEDGNIVSSRNPRDIPAFTKATLRRLA